MRDGARSFVATSLALLVVALVAPPSPALAAGELTVSFVDVGQGDAIVFVGPCGETGVLDVPRGRDEEVLRALEAYGSTRLRWLTVSHFDSDHMGGVTALAEAPDVRIDTVYDRGSPIGGGTKTYKDYARWLRRTSQLRRSLTIGEVYELCGGDERVTFEVVSVADQETEAGGVRVSSENDRGVCLKIVFIRFKMAACGDASRKVERAVAERIGKVDLVKINHHGSRGSSDPAYIRALAPSAAVVSVGKNSYKPNKHPDPEAVRAWEAVGDLYQTSESDGTVFDGDVIATTDGTSSLQVRTMNSKSAETYRLAANSDEQDDDNSDLVEDLAIFGGTLLAVGLGAGIARWMSRRPRSASSPPTPTRAEPPVSLSPVLAFLDSVQARWMAEHKDAHPPDSWPAARDALVAVGMAGPDPEIRKQARALLTRLTRLAHGAGENLDTLTAETWELIDRLKDQADRAVDESS